MPKLVLGPMLRYVSETEATVWIETDSACEVEVLGRRERTFRIEGHDYALVCWRSRAGRLSALRGESRREAGLARARAISAEPAADDRPGRAAPDRLRLMSLCPIAPTLTKDEDPEHGREIDALWAMAVRMREQGPRWPDLLLMLGDQVYADEDAPETRAFIRERRGTDGEPGEEVADFEVHAPLPRELGRRDASMAVLDNVPSAMIFDDHDIHDDWNTSISWLEEMRRSPGGTAGSPAGWSTTGSTSTSATSRRRRSRGGDSSRG